MRTRTCARIAFSNFIQKIANCQNLLLTNILGICASGRFVFSCVCIVILVGGEVIGVFALHRNGGGIGEGSIRKTAYFQSSIDPSLCGPKVSNPVCYTHNYYTSYLLCRVGIKLEL